MAAGDRDETAGILRSVLDDIQQAEERLQSLRRVRNAQVQALASRHKMSHGAIAKEFGLGKSNVRWIVGATPAAAGE